MTFSLVPVNQTCVVYDELLLVRFSGSIPDSPTLIFDGASADGGILVIMFSQFPSVMKWYHGSFTHYSSGFESLLMDQILLAVSTQGESVRLLPENEVGSIPTLPANLPN